MRVAVVGGGIAGASVAYELAGRADVTLFEREPMCGYHSTGRSAALFTECYGDTVVRRLALASRSFVEDPPPGFAAGPLVTPRSLLFIGRSDQEGALAAGLEDYREIVPSVRAVSVDEALELCPVLDPDQIAGAVIEPDAKDLDVHGLHLGFQQGTRDRGGAIVTSAEVVGLERNETWSVSAGGETVDADIVVNAAGAWCDVVAAIAGAAPLGVMPKRRTAFTFAAPEGHREWPMVLDIEEQFYFRPEGPHLLASPCDETPMPPSDVRHEEIDVASGIERIEAATRLRVRTVVNAWAGLRSFVPDHRPVNGWDPEVEGFYWLAGQGGFGIKTSPAMARFAAGMILEGEPPGDLIAAGIDRDSLAADRF